MDNLVNPTLFFDSEDTAQKLVAGLPCAIRALEALARTCDQRVNAQLAAPGGWTRPDLIAQEARRLMPHAKLSFVCGEDKALREMSGFDAAALAIGAPPPACRMAGPYAAGAIAADIAALNRASRALVAQTGKPTDGFVSRWINRPISQFMTYWLLKLRWIRPIHATIAAGIVGVIMALCLFFGGSGGLIAGAILFQMASIIDGVDGEIARATRRSSKSGASLDTATDAATNFAFLGGIIVNQSLGGAVLYAKLGMAGLLMLAAGLALLGAVSIRRGGALSFDALKHDTRTASSGVMTGFARILSRDVYVLVLSALCVAGWVDVALGLFAGITAMWLVTVIYMLLTAGAGE
ncbi:MAG: CDP-alcohol phosphatidyltransferase family protein [Pseudomonadota bacterium]